MQQQQAIQDHISIEEYLALEAQSPHRNEYRRGEISPARRWIIKHALRKLRKAEDPWALGVMERLKSNQTRT